MAKIYFSRIIPADIETVWAVLGDFHGIADWVNIIASNTPEDGSGRGTVGSVRRLTMADGRKVGERLVAYDGVERRYSYEFTEDTKPFPTRRFIATVHILPVTTENTTFLEWYSEFDADHEVEIQLQAGITGRYQAFTDDLIARLATSPPLFSSNSRDFQ